MPLHEKIREYIMDSERPVSYLEIQRRAEKHGIGRRDLIAAMQRVHRMKDVRTVNRMGTIYYDPMPLHMTMKKPGRAPNYPPLIPGVNDASHEIFDGMDFSDLFKTPQELQIDKWRREKELAKELAAL